MSSAHERERLPCGARLETLLLQVTDDERPADPTHQAHCPYCQSTLRRLRAGWGGVVALREEPVAVPSRLTALIMARVRALAGQLSDSILIGHPFGETRVSHDVISRVAARAAGMSYEELIQQCLRFAAERTAIALGAVRRPGAHPRPDARVAARR